jgi:hypothetical protein
MVLIRISLLGSKEAESANEIGLCTSAQSESANQIGSRTSAGPELANENQSSGLSRSPQPRPAHAKKVFEMFLKSAGRDPGQLNNQPISSAVIPADEIANNLASRDPGQLKLTNQNSVCAYVDGGEGDGYIISGTYVHPLQFGHFVSIIVQDCAVCKFEEFKSKYESVMQTNEMLEAEVKVLQ